MRTTGERIWRSPMLRLDRRRLATMRGSRFGCFADCWRSGSRTALRRMGVEGPTLTQYAREASSARVAAQSANARVRPRCSRQRSRGRAGWSPPGIRLLDDLNNPVSARINEHRPVIHDRVAIIANAVFGGHLVVGDAAG